MSAEIPKYQDEVKHKLNETSGIVIAVYEKNGIKYFDVRADNRIYYATLAENWTIVIPYIE
jgi:hypothetical protein